MINQPRIGNKWTRRQIQFPPPDRASGLTLVELIVTVAILAILASAAVPIARFQVKREKERILRHNLWEMRAAIDKYKDLGDGGAFQIKVDSHGYPPDLQTLVDGVDVQGKKIRFLRRIPLDPMTGTDDWGLRSMQDDPTSDSWGGRTSSMSTRNRPERAWMAPSIQTGS